MAQFLLPPRLRPAKAGGSNARKFLGPVAAQGRVQAIGQAAPDQIYKAHDMLVFDHPAYFLVLWMLARAPDHATRTRTPFAEPLFDRVRAR